MCGTDINSMVTRHLQREAESRKSMRPGATLRDFEGLKGVAIDPDESEFGESSRDDEAKTLHLSNMAPVAAMSIATPPASFPQTPVAGIADLQSLFPDSFPPYNPMPYNPFHYSLVQPKQLQQYQQHQHDIVANLRNEVADLHANNFTMACRLDDMERQLGHFLSLLHHGDMLRDEIEALDAEGEYLGEADMAMMNDMQYAVNDQLERNDGHGM